MSCPIMRSRSRLHAREAAASRMFHVKHSLVSREFKPEGRTEQRKAPEPAGSGRAAFLAEAVGFEPTKPCGLTVFKTAAFNHSATPPHGVCACAQRLGYHAVNRNATRNCPRVARSRIARPCRLLVSVLCAFGSFHDGCALGAFSCGGGSGYLAEDECLNEAVAAHVGCTSA